MFKWCHKTLQFIRYSLPEITLDKGRKFYRKKVGSQQSLCLFIANINRLLTGKIAKKNFKLTSNPKENLRALDTTSLIIKYQTTIWPKRKFYAWQLNCIHSFGKADRFER